MRGATRTRCTARIASGPEASDLRERLVAYSPGFTGERVDTDRPFPIAVLTPAPESTQPRASRGERVFASIV
jgi:hypothetical protein